MEQHREKKFKPTPGYKERSGQRVLDQFQINAVMCKWILGAIHIINNKK